MSSIIARLPLNCIILPRKSYGCLHTFRMPWPQDFVKNNFMYQTLDDNCPVDGAPVSLIVTIPVGTDSFLVLHPPSSATLLPPVPHSGSRTVFPYPCRDGLMRPWRLEPEHSLWSFPTPLKPFRHGKVLGGWAGPLLKNG